MDKSIQAFAWQGHDPGWRPLCCFWYHVIAGGHISCMTDMLWDLTGYNLWVWEEEEQAGALRPQFNGADSEGYPAYYKD